MDLSNKSSSDQKLEDVELKDMNKVDKETDRILNELPGDNSDGMDISDNLYSTMENT